MAVFEAGEVLQLGIRIEENGEKAYRKLAEKFSGNGEIRKLFLVLADEEVKHGQKFRSMADEAEKYEPAESYPGEYFSYLRSYADDIIFTQKNLDPEVGKVADAAGALEFGMRRELDSILYYLEMKNFVPGHQHKTLSGIIDEERRHYTKLAGLKKEYAKKG